MEYLYRFRPTSALLGVYKELENQTIFFAAPEQLNDPMEGFKDVVWSGDEIVWRNLLRHYLLCLTQSAAVLMIMGGDHDAVGQHDFSACTASELPTDQYREMFEAICSRFFEDPDVDGLPTQLASLNHKARRDELTFYLRSLNSQAIDIILDTFASRKLAPPRTPNPAAPKQRNLTREFFEKMAAVEKDTATSSIDLVDFFSIAGMVISEAIKDQTAVLRGLAGKSGWASLYFDFPGKYVERLHGLLHGSWYVACFLENPQQSAMWGTYGDSHRGVCLKFRTRPVNGKPVISLNHINGVRFHNGQLSNTYADVDHPLYPVNYDAKAPEIDFFRSLGQLNRSALLANWYSDDKGNVSDCGKHLVEGEEAWRQAHWKTHFRAITTKLADWRHEGEHRAILHSVIQDLSKTKHRLATYKFADLKGVIFGINTPIEDKSAIKEIIRRKCAEAGRSDFEFYQARYSQTSGLIDPVRLPFNVSVPTSSNVASTPDAGDSTP